jgi:hypothetical protein
MTVFPTTVSLEYIFFDLILLNVKRDSAYMFMLCDYRNCGFVKAYGTVLIGSF